MTLQEAYPGQLAESTVLPAQKQVSVARQRDSYELVGAAMRASNTAARAAEPPLSTAMWRLLSAVHDELTSYSRLTDHIAHRRLAELAGIDHRTVRRTLIALQDRGVLLYRSGDGRRPSLISLEVDPELRARVQDARAGRANETRGEQAFGARGQGARAGRASKGARAGRAEVPPGDVHTEKTSEKSFREEPLGADGARARDDRKRDPLFEALVAALSIDAQQLTAAARGWINGALKQLRDVGATPDEIAVRARRYREQHPTWDLTPSALAKHWPNLTESSRAAQPADGQLYRNPPTEAYA